MSKHAELFNLEPGTWNLGYWVMKLVIRLKPHKGRVPHRPTKVEPQRVRYDRKRAKRSVREELKAEGRAN